MYLLKDLAMLLWTSVGTAVAAQTPQVRLKCKRKGARLSLLRIEIYYWRKFTQKIRLTTKFIKQHLPKPKGRMFQWLILSQK